MVKAVKASAPGKINLSLRVGPREADGYHRVANVFQAVDLTEHVTVTPSDSWSVEHSGPFASDDLPADESHQAIRAGLLLAERFLRVPKACHVEVEKNVPVAAGLGSGPADAAAALIACAQLWGLELSRNELYDLAAELGSDVPFALAGGTALGTDHGERLTTLLCRGELTWVLALSAERLPTPAVYRRLDDMREGSLVPEPEASAGLLKALASGEVEQLAPELVNDLGRAAGSLASNLKSVIRAGVEAGALAGLVSGSGPTVAFLARDDAHALGLSVLLSATPGVVGVLRTTGPRPGARIMQTISPRSGSRRGPHRR